MKFLHYINNNKMNEFFFKTVQVFPFIGLLFTIITVITTITINDYEISPIFLYFCIQVYLNWFSINRISRGAATITNDEQSKSMQDVSDIRIQIQNNRPSGFRGDSSNRIAMTTNNDKLWYCEKCMKYTHRPARHCIICKKCFHYRDHHCFFIGGCILRQNMGNFILICIYTSLASNYSLCILAPYLYEHLDHFLGDNSTAFDIILSFSFPVAMARFMFSSQESCILLVAFFDALSSVSCICLVYGLWKLYACLSGRQRYFPYNIKKHDVTEIFGSYGLWNFIFPINGILGAKSLPQQSYMLKEI